MTVRLRKYKSGKKSWICDFYYNGERIVRTLKFAKTKSDAEKAEAILVNQVFKQAYGFSKKPDKRFEDAVIEIFLPYSETNKKSFYDDVLICRVLIRHLKKLSLRQITPPTVEELKQKLFSEKTKRGIQRSPATVNRHLAVLSKICSMAVDSDLLDVNPCRKVKKLKVNNQRTRVLSGEEEERLLLALQNNAFVKNITITALNTGMRRGEIFNLKWFDLDFNRKVICVRESKANKKRFVPMNKTLLSLFQNLKRKSEFVFPSPNTGQRLNNIKKGFNRALKEAEVINFRFHDLRHTSATRMAEAGVDAFTLAKILGHSDIRMTNRYTHTSDVVMHKAVANLEKDSDFGYVLVTRKKTGTDEFP